MLKPIGTIAAARAGRARRGRSRQTNQIAQAEKKVRASPMTTNIERKSSQVETGIAISVRQAVDRAAVVPHWPSVEGKSSGNRHAAIAATRPTASTPEMPTTRLQRGMRSQAVAAKMAKD